MSLDIKNLKVKIEDKTIIKDLNLQIQPGEIHVIMGPNGSGKSTLANAVMGHPKYEITNGSINIDNKDITESKVSEKAKEGLFLSMQYPPEISGVTISSFLRTAFSAINEKKQNPIEFHRSLISKMSELGIDESFASRYLNLGFSGGEKKKMEILQLLVLEPKYAILDETDSGLDIDALKIVADGINKFSSKETGVLLITHYQRILDYIKPDKVHIMKKGEIVESGGPELAKRVEKSGYEF